MKRKSTMVELVSELENLYRLHPVDGILKMIEEAKAGEYHDFKNNKYVCGKTESYNRLMMMQFDESIALAKRIFDGEFDEEADFEDIMRLRKEGIEDGLTEGMLLKFGFGLEHLESKKKEK